MAKFVDEDFHDLRIQGPFVSDVRCEVCSGRTGGMRLIEGAFYHRDPADCAARRARLR